jgi:hypothetical protein
MKKIVRLTEFDLTRIVRRVINESRLLTEGVPNTTLTSGGDIAVAARTVCTRGNDYIMASFIVDNTAGAADAYLTQSPYLSNISSGGGFPTIKVTGQYNVTIGGKPSWGQADQQNSPKIPKGKKATVNIVLSTNQQSAVAQMNAKPLEPAGGKLYQEYWASLKTLKTGTMNVRYNGVTLAIPMTFGGFTTGPTTACDAAITLPKGF